MHERLGFGDRVLRSLFVACAVGLGWGIRGDFGHVLGAMYPGACLGLGFAYVTGQRSMFRWMPIVGGLAGLGIGLGGMMSYGILHGYAKSDSFVNYSYGFATLVLQGGAWGCFGCAIVGLLLEEKTVRATEWLSGIVTVLVFGWVFYYLIHVRIGFDINPYRSNLSIGFTGGVIALFVWLIRNGKRSGLRGAFFGYLGFGLGMAGGRVIGNVSAYMGLTINHWNVMEVLVGFVGGFVFTFGMLGRRFGPPAEEKSERWLASYAIVYVLGLIPLFHRLLRMPDSRKLSEWAGRLESYGFDNPEALSETVSLALNGVCALGFVAAGIWLFLHRRDYRRFAAFPVLGLSVVMLLTQQLNALVFFYPRDGFLVSRTGEDMERIHVNMHDVFWVLLAWMFLDTVIRAIVSAFRRRADYSALPTSPLPLRWGRWGAGALATFVVIVIVGGIVNGEHTVGSANTRFPLWSWREGRLDPHREEHHIFRAGEAGYHTYRIPAMIESGGTILAFCEGRKTSANDTGDIDVVLRRSSDRGVTWSELQVVADHGTDTIGNPTPLIDRDTGVIWLFLTKNPGGVSEEQILAREGEGSRTVWVTKSSNRGATWSPAVDITATTKKSGWTWYSTGPGIGIQLRNGRLLVPSCHAKEESKTYFSHVIYSDDHGESWQLGGTVGEHTTECQVIERADGSLILNARSLAGKNRRALATSLDGGMTWSEFRLAEELVEPPCQASLLRFTDGAHYHKDRVLFSNPASIERVNMTVRVSGDEGATWKGAKTLFAGPAAYSSLAVLRDHWVGCLYENGDATPYERISFTRFNVPWLTDGEERVRQRRR